MIGEGGSGGALAIGVADRVIMLEDSYYSVICPRAARRSCSRTRSRPRGAAAALSIDRAGRCCASGSSTRWSRSPGGRAHRPATAAANLKPAIVTELRELLALLDRDLLAQRYERFRVFGAPGPPSRYSIQREDDDRMTDTESLRGASAPRRRT